VANALEEAHRRGIVHRDVKPANVLVPLDGPVKVTDFGIAKAADSSDLTSSGTIIGTARYLAPEQVRGEPADGRADIYGVGLLLHEMIAGSLPFRGDTEMATALARLTTPPAALPAGTPAPVAAIVARCLAVNPDDRWPTAHALATALDTAAKGGEVEGPPIAQPRDTTGGYGTRGPTPTPAAARQPARQPRRRKRAVWPWAILGGLLLGAGAGGGYLLVDDLAKEKDGENGNGNGVAVEMVRAQDFDPEGTDPQQENRELAPLAIDGSASTSWRTERYSTPDLGGGKSGVGIFVVLSGATDISFVEVDAQASGWSAQIYAADEPATSLAGWGAPLADGEDLDALARFDLDGQGGAVLIWITLLPDSGQLEVSEIRIG
jgi:serine/threonine-protein kinase